MPEGLAGTNGEPILSLSDRPVLGEKRTLDITNSLGKPTTMLILFGMQKANVPTAFRGRLLVTPNIAELLIALPAAGLKLPGKLPANTASWGQQVFLQGLQLDAGAPLGISFSKGLALLLGI